jgi:hypothetical protein
LIFKNERNFGRSPPQKKIIWSFWVHLELVFLTESEAEFVLGKMPVDHSSKAPPLGDETIWAADGNSN